MKLLNILLQAGGSANTNISWLGPTVAAIIIVIAISLINLRNSKKTNTGGNHNQLEISTYRYPALRTIAVFFKTFAWVIGLTTLGITTYFLNEVGEFGKIFAVISVVIGGLIVLGLAAISESIKVLIDIEYNTRKVSAKE